MKALIPQEVIEKKILCIRGTQVMLDRDLASFYGVSTTRLNEQVKRNLERFPEEFMFQLTKEEKAEVIAFCDNPNSIKFSPQSPYVFTEYGAIMLANVIKSKIAIQASILIVKAFSRFREILATQKEIVKKLSAIEQKIIGHDKSLKLSFKLIYELASDPDAFRPRKPSKVIEGFSAGNNSKK